MVGYLDSSVLLRHILLGDEKIRKVFACTQVISSELLEIECRRVIHRYRLTGELDDEGFITASNRLSQILQGISILILSPAVKKRAGEAFPVIIKTLDAIHLSSALIFAAARPADSLQIFSHDQGINRCARALGFSTPFQDATV